MTLRHRNRIAPHFVALGALTLALAACDGSGDTSGGAATSAETPSTVESPGPTTKPGTAGGEDPTCELIIPDSTVQQFEDLGWTVREESMRIAGVEYEGGVSCTWGDPAGATDLAQIFAWAPLTTEQAKTARADLIEQGWRVVDDSSGDFITEDHGQVSSPDAEGYGATFEFGDGWVKQADTKQSLVLIEWPRS